ncbi:MAG: PIN domain-containing protein [Acidobacteria bacterium]|nr:MAG: PIN domain-containing protein [Acidobacteriota bacterium]
MTSMADRPGSGGRSSCRSSTPSDPARSRSTMPESTRFYFPDINVWLALAYGQHQHHTAAERWYTSLPQAAQLYFCRFTQLGFLRLLTTQAVLGDDALDQPGAWSAYDQLMRDGRVGFAVEMPGLDATFRRMASLRQPASKDWVDSYLAAFAESAGFALVTFDRGLARKAPGSIQPD